MRVVPNSDQHERQSPSSGESPYIPMAEARGFTGILVTTPGCHVQLLLGPFGTTRFPCVEFSHLVLDLVGIFVALFRYLPHGVAELDEVLASIVV